MTSNSQQLLTAIVNKIFRSATKTRNKYDRLRVLRFVAKLIVFLAAFTHDVLESLDKREICRFRKFDCSRNISAIRTCSRLIDFAVSQRTNRSRNTLIAVRINVRAENVS
jgi:hypothetical protein